jgi:hypothetical protein
MKNTRYYYIQFMYAEQKGGETLGFFFGHVMSSTNMENNAFDIPVLKKKDLISLCMETCKGGIQVAESNTLKGVHERYAKLTLNNSLHFREIVLSSPGKIFI